MLDPNPAITGKGQRVLRDANIVTEFFTSDLMTEIEELNRDFIRSWNTQLEGRLSKFSLVKDRLIRRPTYLYRRSIQLARRSLVTWLGAPKRDFFADTMRLVGLFGLGYGILLAYGVNVLSLLKVPLIDSRIVLLPSILLMYLHAFVYLFFRRPTRWNIEYRNRKLNLTASFESATACINESVTNNRIRNMERNALAAIKSYLDFTVLDDGTSFSVNLLVKHPAASGQLVCIRRSNTTREFPLVYKETSMRKVVRSLETGEIYYDGNYSREGKPYKMVWHVPIPSPHFKGAHCVGLVCVDRLKARHLDLIDERRSLLLNLSPYINILGYALSLRFKHNIWEPLD